MNSSQHRREARLRRSARVSKKIRGTDSRPRLCVFRSNKYLYAQLVSDQSGRTLGSVSSLKSMGPGVTAEKAKALGQQLAEVCKRLGVAEVVFDRAGYRYHGRIKALADAARENGMKF